MSKKCVGRVWKDGVGGQCSRKGMTSTTIGFFCAIHLNLYKECIDNDCIRGIEGLGGCWSCENIHDGLWLGSVKKERPLYNQNGLLLPWKDEKLIKNKKKSKKKNKKKTGKIKFIKLKNKYNNSIMIKSGKTQMISTLKKTMNSLDLDNPDCTPDYIISIVEEKLEKKFKEKDKQRLYKEIDKIYEKLIELELSPSSSEDEDDVCTDNLYTIIYNNKEWLKDIHTYNVYTKTKKPRYVGYQNSDGSITFEVDL